MALDPDLVSPGRTAIVINEMQRGTVGDRSGLPMLAESARPAVEAVARLVIAGRDAGVEIVHCVVGSRPDHKGMPPNTVFSSPSKRVERSAEEIAAFAEVVPEISVDPGDVVLSRLGGMSPMTEDGLDTLLRSAGITTIVAAGVSLNIGVYGLVLKAIDKAYDVVLPRDACAGVPSEYGDAVIDNSLRLLARVTTVDELTSIWKH